MEYDYTLLRQKMIEKNLNHSELATRIGMKIATFSNRMNSKNSFKQSEIYAICKALSIPMRQIDRYFFTLKI